MKGGMHRNWTIWTGMAFCLFAVFGFREKIPLIVFLPFYQEMSAPLK